ncbi:helix-turn-helix domain-containing protein [Magnetospirillum sp. UT-4]|uniref:helix-turn-helix domain-containing protein n=1 Tax=Magnetospirillum sp. UT-4 TaxID=2681467 RepID=UPI0013800E19
MERKRPFIPRVGPVDRQIGARIREARIASGLTLDRLGRECGVTWAQVRMYERGRNRVSASRLHAIATAVGRPLDWFFA